MLRERQVERSVPIRIQLEALACEEIFLRAEIEEIQYLGPSCMRMRPFFAPFRID